MGSVQEDSSKFEGSGVDSLSLSEFEKVRRKELYKIWNRLSSGSYFPQMVKRVQIPKGNESCDH